MVFATNSPRADLREIDNVKAAELARGSAVVAADQLDKAYTKPVTDLRDFLTTELGYQLARDSGLGEKGEAYIRSMSQVFENPTVRAVIIIPTDASPESCTIIGIASVGDTTQEFSIRLVLKPGIGVSAE